MAGLGSSVGGGAAEGLQAGFDMGLRATAQQDARDQRARENQRQDRLDDERTTQTARTNANSDDDRALTAVNSEMEDHRLAGAGLAAQHGGVDKIPQSEGSAYAAKANEIAQRRTALLAKRYQPVVNAEQTWAKDTASRIATGQINMDDLSPGDTVRLLQATTRRPITDFLRPTDGSSNGNSVVGQGVADTTAGIKTNNQGLTIQGAGTLMAPDINVGLGHVAPDGSEITGKSLYALVPAPAKGMAPGQQAPIGGANPVLGLSAALTAAMSPAPAQPGAQPAAAPPGAQPAPAAPAAGAPGGTGTIAPSGPAPGAQLAPAAGGGNEGQLAPTPQPPLVQGTDPNNLLPVLQVTAQHPDGTEVSYHAPITVGRGTGPDDQIHPGISMSDAMERMGKLSTLETWANTPQARAKIEAGVKELGPQANSFLSAYYAMHGDAKALLPPGTTDPTSLKIKAIQKLADDKYGGDFDQAMQAFNGKQPTGVQAKINAIDELDIPDDQKDKLKQDVALGAGGKTTGLIKTPPKTAKATGVGGGTLPGSTDGALSGPELLAKQSPADQATIKGLLDGSIKPETLSVRNNHRENLVSLAARVGSMDTGAAANHTKTENAFVNGQQGKSIKAFNTAVDHLGTLDQLATALNNGDIKTANQLKNAAASWTGDADITNFDTAKRIVADEVVKAIVGSGGALGDRESAEKTIMGYNSPAQLKGTVATYKKLMAGQLTALGQQYQSGGGTKDFSSTFLLPAARELYHAPPRSSGLGGGAGSGGGSTSFGSADEAAAAAAAGKIKSGDRITVGGQSGTWH